MAARTPSAGTTPCNVSRGEPALSTRKKCGLERNQNARFALSRAPPEPARTRDRVMREKSAIVASSARSSAGVARARSRCRGYPALSPTRKQRPTAAGGCLRKYHSHNQLSKSGRWHSNKRRPAWEGGRKTRADWTTRQFPSENAMLDAPVAKESALIRGSNGSRKRRRTACCTSTSIR